MKAQALIWTAYVAGVGLIFASCFIKEEWFCWVAGGVALTGLAAVAAVRIAR